MTTQEYPAAAHACAAPTPRTPPPTTATSKSARIVAPRDRCGGGDPVGGRAHWREVTTNAFAGHARAALHDRPAARALPSPRPPGAGRRMRQRIHIARTADDVHLAWARAGSGPVLVKASNWLTHLRQDLDSPVWRHWLAFFFEHFDFVRFDERGCGMSDRDVDDVSEQ